MYQSLVRKLIYLAHTRLDITYAMNVVSQFMYDPREVHLQAVYRILYYLKASLRTGILFKGMQGWCLKPTHMQIMQDHQWTGDLLRVIAFFLEAMLSHGGAKSKW